METERAYEVLGLGQSASFSEVMEAHRDLVEVWDPKRFHDNLRLQRRAIQELALINEAFDTLRLHALQGRAHQPGESDRTLQTTSVPSSSAGATIALQRGAEIPRASLYEDALSGSRGRQRFLTLLPLITGVILALVVIIWILTSDSGSNIDDQPSGPPAAAEPAQQSAAPLQAQQAAPQHAALPSPRSAVSPDARLHKETKHQGVNGAETTAPLVRQAFQLLREKSKTASSLVQRGRYEDLRFESWAPLRAELNEFQLQLIAVREPGGDRVRLVWSVNLETQTVSPLNDAARELEDRESGPKPQLIRQM